MKLFSYICTASVLSLASAASIEDTAQPCSAVHIIASRATGELPGQGIISSLARLVQQEVPGTTIEALIYPAMFPYSESIPLGVSALTKRIEDYSAACPDSKLVLMGYSQGAAVTVDTLCGGGGKDIGPTTKGLTLAEGRTIAAAVMMGDPRFVPGTLYDAGTNKLLGGVAKRDPYVAACGIWASRMISYCDTDDARCASGNSGLVHMTYLDRYTNSSLAFIKEKLQAGSMKQQTLFRA